MSMAAARDQGNQGSEGKHGRFAKLLQKLQSLGLGVAAAIATVVAIDHFRDEPVSMDGKDSKVPATEKPQDRPMRTVVIESAGLDRIAALERQIQDLEARKEALPEKPRADPEQQKREVDESYAKLTRAHDGDAPDPEWSAGAQHRLVTSLTPLAEELGFKLGPAECKTTTCRATVTWTDYATARATGMRLIEETYPGLNCVRRIRLGEPGDPNTAYAAQLYLDCADQRAGLVDEIAAN